MNDAGRGVLRTAAVLGLAWSVPACGSPLDSNERIVIGFVEGLSTDSPAIEMPDTVEIGSEFEITIYTTWPNGCARTGGADVRVDGNHATVTPHTIVREYATCTQAPQRLTHEATLQFPESGAAEVVVRGRASADADVTEWRRSITVE